MCLGHDLLLIQLLTLQSLAVLESLGAMLTRQFGFVADVHFMCLKGNVTTRQRQQMITSFNTSQDCKVRLMLWLAMRHVI
jgi:SNF2 family DNA or RNA helicase